MEIPFHGTYDRKAFLEALKLTEKRSALYAVFRYLALVLSLVLIAAAIYTWILGGMEQSDTGRLIRNVISAAIPGYFYFSAIITRNRSIANLFRSGPKRTMRGNVNLQGVTIEIPPHNATIDWDRFVSKGEKEKLFALMTVDGSLAVFHREFFENESDWQRFRQLVNQKVIEPK